LTTLSPTRVTHKSQPGSTFIEFWIKTPQTQEANADSTVDVETDATENALPSLPDQFPNSLHSAIEGLAPEVSVNIAPATTTGSTDAVDHVANMQERIDELQADTEAQFKKLQSIAEQTAQACDSTASASAAADIPSEASVSTAYSKEYLSKLASSGSNKTDKVINLIINRRGNQEGIHAGIRSLVSYFPTRLDEIAVFLGRQIGLTISDWTHFQEVLMTEMKRPEYQDEDISIAQLLMIKASRPPDRASPGKKKPRRKK